MATSPQPRAPSPSILPDTLQAHINHKIINEINQGLLEIPSQPLPFLVQKTSYFSEQINMVKSIRESKSKALEELHELEAKQSEIKKIIHNLSKSRSKSKTPEKSSFTKEEKLRIREILRLKKRREKTQRARHQDILDSFEKQMKLGEEQRAKSIDRMRQQRKQKASKNMLDFQLRQQVRRENNEETKKRMKELRTKKYIFKLHQQKDQQKRALEQQCKRQKLKQVHQKLKLNLEEIRQHSKRVKTMDQQRENLRRQKMSQITQSRKKSIVRHAPSVFMKLIASEQDEKRVNQLRKQMFPLEYKQKIKQFDSYVRENFKPERQSSTPITTTTPPKRVANTLSVSQRNKEGNENLKIAKKRRKHRDSVKIVTEPQIIRYKNYLLDMERSESKNKTAEKFKSLLNSSSLLTEYEVVEKASFLVEEIQAKSKKNKDAKVIESIRHKLDILKALG